MPQLMFSQSSTWLLLQWGSSWFPSPPLSPPTQSSSPPASLSWSPLPCWPSGERQTFSLCRYELGLRKGMNKEMNNRHLFFSDWFAEEDHLARLRKDTFLESERCFICLFIPLVVTMIYTYCAVRFSKMKMNRIDWKHKTKCKHRSDESQSSSKFQRVFCFQMTRLDCLTLAWKINRKEKVKW